MIDRFAAPGFFALLPLAGLLAFWWLWRARRRAVRYSDLSLAANLPRGWRARLTWLPGLLALAGLAFAVVALARPQRLHGQTRMSTEGVAIQMIIDRSASMTAPMMYEGQRLTRLEVVKHVFEQFIEGNGAKLKGRRGDMIGLIAFAGHAETVSPLVRSYEVLVELARRTPPAPPALPEGGTAIGDALALAAARLKSAEEQIQRLNADSDEPPEFTIKSKVIVLLTDGENNAGEIEPLVAAEQARQWGIKIYTIGIGGTGGIVYIQGNEPGTMVPIRDWIDERSLSGIAEMTGGVYWNARDAETLERIYAELDQLEQTSIETIDFTRTEERFAPFAASAAGLLLAQLVLRLTMLRRLP